ncbi:hypothetical protein [Pseudonocardia sp. GCM10023141]|uniref:hypothetical protein n=1 Tax=Pseudonocardia sp. GCM10023141 TaxID=3252653 RepID=UPI00361B40FA
MFIEDAGLNHAWWAWQRHHDSVYDGFDLMRGPDSTGHTDAASPLRDAITTRWATPGPRPP